MSLPHSCTLQGQPPTCTKSHTMKTFTPAKITPTLTYTSKSHMHTYFSYLTGAYVHILPFQQPQCTWYQVPKTSPTGRLQTRGCNIHTRKPQTTYRNKTNQTFKNTVILWQLKTNKPLDCQTCLERYRCPLKPCRSRGRADSLVR